MFILGFRSCLLQYYTLFYMASEPGWNPCKPYAEDAPVLVERHAKVTNDAKLYLPPS